MMPVKVPTTPIEDAVTLDSQISALEGAQYQTERQLRELKERRAEIQKKCTLVGPYGLDLSFIEVTEKDEHLHEVQLVREVKILAITPTSRSGFVNIERPPEFLLRQSARAHKEHFELILKELRDRLVDLVPK